MKLQLALLSATLVVLFLVPSTTATSCTELGRRKCRCTDGCSWTNDECVDTPPFSCEGASYLRCAHKAPYSDLCKWNKHLKTCEDASSVTPLCRDWSETNIGGSWAESRFGATLAYLEGQCIPDCVDNPVNQFLPDTERTGGAVALDPLWEETGLDPLDRDNWCPVVYGDKTAGKMVGPLPADHPLIGFGLECDESHHGSQLTAWHFAWSTSIDNPLGWFAYWTGDTVCCETCGTCQTDKFRCATPDPERGAYPCGSNAWGLNAGADFYTGSECYPDWRET